MSKQGLFKNSDGLVEFYEDKIDLQVLEETYKAVSGKLNFGDVIWPRHMSKDALSKKLVDKIESRLAQNNNEYSRFASDYVHCKLSYDVYNIKLKRDDTLESDKNWKVIETFAVPNDESSSKRGSIYFAALYYNKYKGQSILAHRGIEAKASDFFKTDCTLVDNLSGILLHEYVPQLVKCYEVTERCYRIAKQLRCTLSFTGFSNGAWLAENCIYFCEKYIKADYVFDFEDFFEVETKAVLFESPGIFRSKNEYKSNIISNEYEFDIKGLNIVNYLLSPNLMNSINLHVGQVFRLFMDEKDQIDLKNKEFLQKFSNIPIIGKKISEYSVEVRYLYNGLNSMFNSSVLKKILDSCFDPVTESAKNYCQMISWPLIKIDFYKNIKDNLKDAVDDTFENLLEMIPFLNQIEIVSKPIQFVTRKITAKLTQSLMEGFAPAIHVLLCIMIEFFKGNLDLKFCNNALFYKREDEIDQIVVNNEYIKEKYSSSSKQKSTTPSQNLEKKIEKKFSLFFNSNYIPMSCKKVESKLLNISDDYSRNVDWILFHLKRGSHFKNVKSKIVRNHLASLRELYEIENVNVKEKVIYVMRIKMNEEFNFDKLRESLLRILSISREDIREIIFRNNSIINLNFAHNLGIRRSFVKRKKIIEQLTDFFYENNVLYLYGKPGTGKSLLAKEFGFRFLESGRVRFFESEDKFQFLNSYHKFLLNFLDEYTTDFRSVDYDKLGELASVKLLQQESLILFIFDNVELFDVIEKEVCNFLHNEKIKILITTRNQDFNRSFQSIEVKFFDKKEADEYVKLNNQENLLNQKIVNSIISKIGIKNEQKEIEILPKTLEINIKYLLENYITDDLRILIDKGDFQIFEYVFRTLDPDQMELLRYFSFMNPKRINVLIVKDIFKMETKTERSSKITDCIMKLSNIGIIDVHKKEKCLSMHRLIKNEVKKIFGSVNEKKQYLKKLIRFILKNLKENMDTNNEDLNDEFLEHLYEIVKENFDNIGVVLSKVNSFLTATHWEKKIFDLMLKISQEIHNILLNSNNKDKSLIDYSINNLGICNFYLGKVNESVNLLNKAADHTVQNIQLAQSHFFLAKCYSQLNNDEKSLVFYKKSFDLYKKLLNNKLEDRPMLFDCLNNMAGCYLRMNKLEKAIEVYLEIEAHFGNNKHIYKCLHNLAHCYLKLDNVDSALKYFRESLRILDDEKLINEKEESELAKLSNSIGFCLSKKNEFKEALTFYERAYDLQLNEVNYDIDTDSDKTNIELSSYLNNIGVCHLKLGDYKDALHFCEQALKMRKLVDQINHVDLVISLKNLALCYYKNGQETEADEYFKEAEKVSDKFKK